MCTVEGRCLEYLVCITLIYCSLLEELKLAKETNLSNPKPQKGIYSSSGRLANLVAQNVCNLNQRSKQSLTF